MSFTTDDIQAGQAVYSPWVLRVYDWWVLGVSNRFLWRCPTKVLLRHFETGLSDLHLDVGVGSGYYPAHARFPSDRPSITLMDLNPHALAHAFDRLEGQDVQVVQADVLQPVPMTGLMPFRSVSCFYLLHCLPGRLADKAVLFDHVLPLMADGAVIMGATILGEPGPRGGAARWLMKLYNRKRIFCNAHDSLPDLERELSARFTEVDVRVVGTVALFSARKPHRPGMTAARTGR